jgi:hypothetical protein
MRVRLAFVMGHLVVLHIIVQQLKFSSIPFYLESRALSINLAREQIYLSAINQSDHIVIDHRSVSDIFAIS